jgi:hypothetical protein
MLPFDLSCGVVSEHSNEDLQNSLRRHLAAH